MEVISSHQSEWLSLRSQQISNAEKSGEEGTLPHSWWECKLYSHCGEQSGDSL